MVHARYFLFGLLLSVRLAPDKAGDVRSIPRSRRARHRSCRCYNPLLQRLLHAWAHRDAHPPVTRGLS